MAEILTIVGKSIEMTNGQSLMIYRKNLTVDNLAHLEIYLQGRGLLKGELKEGATETLRAAALRDWDAY